MQKIKLGKLYVLLGQHYVRLGDLLISRFPRPQCIQERTSDINRLLAEIQEIFDAEKAEAKATAASAAINAKIKETTADDEAAADDKAEMGSEIKEIDEDHS